MRSSPSAVRTRSSVRRRAAQEAVDRRRDVVVDGELVLLLDLDDHVEGRRRLALEHRLLRAAPARLLVGERDRLDAADEVRERRVLQQVLERVAVRGGDELHAALGDGARRERLCCGADLVDDDHLAACGSRPPRSSPRAARSGAGTCMRRARPMPGCGMSPSPAISFEVSTMTTRLPSSSASTRADFAQQGGLADAGPAEHQDATCRPRRRRA